MALQWFGSVGSDNRPARISGGYTIDIVKST